MRVSGEYDVDSLHPRGELAVHVEAVVGEQHDEVGALLPGLVDARLHVLLADAEGPAGDHPARVGDGRVGKGLPDHRDLRAAALEHLRGLEGRLVPFGVANVLAQERAAEPVHDLLNPFGAEGELPVARHGVGLQQRHAVDHVLALAHHRGVAVLPGIAAIEEQNLVAALGADRVEHRGDAVEAAHPAVAAGQGNVVLRRQRIGQRRAAGDAVEVEVGASGDVGDLTARLAHPEIGRGLAEQHGLHLRVDVGQVDQGDVAHRLEGQEVVLGQALLGEGAGPARRHQGRGGGGDLQEVAA